MKKWPHHVLALTLLAFSALSRADDAAQDELLAQMRALKWQTGPVSVQVSEMATMKIPKEAAFLDEKEGARFLKLTGNLPAEANILTHENWWAVFSFSPVGYVKDDEKIDADALLKSLQEQDKAANAERRKLGMSEVHTEGWFIQPHYDEASKHLEWAVKLRTSGSSNPTVNYTVRLLGRSGYESVILVSDPQSLNDDVKSFKAVLNDFDFKSGEKYSEFKQGDRVAEFGLAALIVGGAAAVATKSGFWKALVASIAAFWKVLLAGVVAIFLGIRKFLGRKQQP